MSAMARSAMVGKLQIPLRSGIVNSAVFVVIDVLCLWAIHRGLMAIQGLTIWHKIRSGRSVELKRSKVPIVSGELLHSTGVVNWLVGAHMVFVVLAAFSTFGIDGAMGTQRVSVPRGYESYMLSSRSDTDLVDAYAQRVLLRCRDIDGSTITYNRATFDLVGNAKLSDPANFRDSAGRAVSVDQSSLLCIDGNPMLKVVNCTACFSPTQPIRTEIRVRKRKIKLPNNTVTIEPTPISNRKKPRGRDAAHPAVLAVRREVTSVRSGFARIRDEIFCVEREKLAVRVFALPSVTPSPESGRGSGNGNSKPGGKNELPSASESPAPASVSFVPQVSATPSTQDQPGAQIPDNPPAISPGMGSDFENGGHQQPLPFELIDTKQRGAGLTSRAVRLEAANRILEAATPSPSISPLTSEFRCVLARWDDEGRRVKAWFGHMEIVRRQVDDSLLTLEVTSGAATIEANNKTTMESIFELGPYLLGPLRGNSLLDILDTSVLLLSGARTAGSGTEVGLPPFPWHHGCRCWFSW